MVKIKESLTDLVEFYIELYNEFIKFVFNFIMN